MYAFSYEASAKYQEVYQTYMVLLFVSSYAFTVSYLLLPSEYTDEWPLLEHEVSQSVSQSVSQHISKSINRDAPSHSRCSRAHSLHENE